MPSQETDEAFTFSSKMARIRSLLEALCNRVNSTRQALFLFMKEKIEALKKKSSDIIRFPINFQLH